MIDRVRSVLESHPEVVFAYVHGSFLDPAAVPRDLDVAVYVSQATARGSGILAEAGLEDEVERALGGRVPVDLRVLNTAPPIFRFRALQGELLLDRDPDLRAAVTADAACRYNDLAPFLAHYAKEAYGHDD